MHAEETYLFRHALARDAAYELHLPAARAHLHALALELIEGIWTGEPERSPFALELAEHARLAQAHRASANLEELKRLNEKERIYLHAAAKQSEGNFDFAEAQRLWERLAEVGVPEERPLALRCAGRNAVFSGKRELGREYFTEAVSAAREVGDIEEQGRAVGSLGNLNEFEGNAEESLAMHRQARELFEQAGSDRDHGIVIGNIANALRYLGRYEEAEQHYRDSIEMLNGVDAPGEALSTMNLGLLYLWLSRPRDAEPYLVKALEQQRTQGNRTGEGKALSALGELYIEYEDFETAAKYMDEAEKVLRETGDLAKLGHLYNHRGQSSYHQGRYEESEQHFRRAIEMLNETGSLRLMALAMVSLGECMEMLERRDEAEAITTQALEIQRGMGDKLGQARGLAQIGKLQWLRESTAEAKESLTAAINLAEQGVRSQIRAFALLYRALCLLKEGDRAAAEADWEALTQLNQSAEELEKWRTRMEAECRALETSPLGSSE